MEVEPCHLLGASIEICRLVQIDPNGVAQVVRIQDSLQVAPARAANVQIESNLTELFPQELDRHAVQVMQA